MMMKLMRKLTIGAMVLAMGSVLVAGGIHAIPANAAAQSGYQSPEDLFNAKAPAMDNPKEAFTTLRKAITYAGLDATFKGPGPMTVFAPDDRAFAALPPAELKALIQDKAKLATVLKYHVIVGQAIKASELPGMKSRASLEGGVLTFATTNAMMGMTMLSGNRGSTASGGQVVTVNNADIIWSDIVVSNGIVHAIDKVLMPKM